MLSEPEWLTNPAAFGFKLQGVPGTYAIEVSTNLQQWTKVTDFLSPGGSMSFTDTAVGVAPGRFYRARAAP